MTPQRFDSELARLSGLLALWGTSGAKPAPAAFVAVCDQLEAATEGDLASTVVHAGARLVGIGARSGQVAVIGRGVQILMAGVSLHGVSVDEA